MGGSAKMTKLFKATKQLGSQVPIIGDSFENRRDQFVKEVNSIGDKYQIALRPQLIYTREGIAPQYVYIDVKAAKEKENSENKPKDHLPKKE